VTSKARQTTRASTLGCASAFDRASSLPRTRIIPPCGTSERRIGLRVVSGRLYPGETRAATLLTWVELKRTSWSVGFRSRMMIYANTG
jgi:hypothetical protein